MDKVAITGARDDRNYKKKIYRSREGREIKPKDKVNK